MLAASAEETGSPITQASVRSGAHPYILPELLKDMRTNLDWVKLVFVGLGMTSTCQPLDKAIMKPPVVRHSQRSYWRTWSRRTSCESRASWKIGPTWLSGWLKPWIQSLHDRRCWTRFGIVWGGAPSRRQLRRRLPMPLMACCFGKGVARCRQSFLRP
eukprot:4762063-Amphidinium_carterae.1